VGADLGQADSGPGRRVNRPVVALCRNADHGNQVTTAHRDGGYRQRGRFVVQRRTALYRRPGSAGQSRLGLALLVIAVSQLMVLLDTTIVTMALPRIQSALGFSTTGLLWVVNLYGLIFGGLLLSGGRVGDILGRRRVLIFGLVLFSAASLLGGVAQDKAWLLAARAAQGVGAALIAPAALALIVANFPRARNAAGPPAFMPRSRPSPVPSASWSAACSPPTPLGAGR
jgi:MFS family permease